jgi:hypothetical protein
LPFFSPKSKFYFFKDVEHEGGGVMMVLGHPHHLTSQFRRQHSLFVRWLAVDLKVFVFSSANMCLYGVRRWFWCYGLVVSGVVVVVRLGRSVQIGAGFSSLIPTRFGDVLS